MAGLLTYSILKNLPELTVVIKNIQKLQSLQLRVQLRIYTSFPFNLFFRSKTGPKLKCNIKLNFLILIFESRNQNDKWDGTCNGVKCPTGVYVSRFEFFYKNARQKNIITRRISLYQ